MKILGVHLGLWPKTEQSGNGFAQHDAAAALIDEGAVVAAVEDERLNRIKHSNFFPIDAIDWALRAGEVTLESVDRVAVNISKAAADLLELNGLKGPKGLGSLFQRCLGVDITDKLAFCHHHLAHAASSYYPSGFDTAAVVSLDGDGEGLSGIVLRAQEGVFRPVTFYPAEISLGNFYSGAIEFLGYRRFDEYKVMGLAPYGNPEHFRSLFREAYELLPDGNYRLSLAALRAALVRKQLIGALGRRVEGVESIHQDYAAALQEMLEQLVLHIMRYARSIGEAALCYAGGVAHNAVANGKILRSGLFERMFVQGAAHDAGGALGAALWTWHHERAVRPRATASLLLGPDIGNDAAIEHRLNAWGPALSFSKPHDIAIAAARALAQGRIMGWAQGRVEFGPRALGHRSIFADPRPLENRKIINSMVKRREAFRPFAPMVLERSASTYFELPATSARLADMAYVVAVRPEWREVLGAVTHIDGTARLQVVSPNEEPLLARLLEAFESEIGFPILLNTSLNNNVEPIAANIDDVVTCFLTTGLHALAIGSWWVEKGIPVDEAIGQWVLSLRDDQRLTTTPNQNSDSRFAIQSNAEEYFVERRHSVSARLVEVLSTNRGTLLDCTSQDKLKECSSEIIDLWGRRAIRLLPR